MSEQESIKALLALETDVLVVGYVLMALIAVGVSMILRDLSIIKQRLK